MKNSEIFKNEAKIIENFFNLENNNNINNKINLIIKESNNIYEFNCILLENSFDMGIFEKIKRCMKDKENNHNIVNGWIYCNNPIEIARDFIRNANEKRIVPINIDIEKIIIYTNKDNIDKLKMNVLVYEEDFEKSLNERNRLEKEIDDLEQENERLHEQIEKLENNN